MLHVVLFADIYLAESDILSAAFGVLRARANHMESVGFFLNDDVHYCPETIPYTGRCACL